MCVRLRGIFVVGAAVFMVQRVREVAEEGG